MVRKREKPVGCIGSWSRRQLSVIDTAIEKIESSNLVVRYFNRDSLNVLKKQKQYVKTMIEKEKAFVEYKRLQGTPNQVEIVKANKALEKQLAAGEDIKYVSKKEETRLANAPRKRKVRSDKGKSHNWNPKVIKASELKPSRFY